jgi:hypothetical protein
MSNSLHNEKKLEIIDLLEAIEITVASLKESYALNRTRIIPMTQERLQILFEDFNNSVK